MATLPYNSTIYKNTLTQVQCTIDAGQTTSSILRCINSAIGTGTLIAIELPTGFTTGDLTFLRVDLTNASPDAQIYVTDGVSNTVPITFPNVAAGKIVYPPFFFYGEDAIRIVSSVVQAAARTITGYLQPITQGAA